MRTTSVCHYLQFYRCWHTIKYSRRSDLPDCIDILLAEAPELDERDLILILTYLEKGPIAVSNKVMHEALSRLVPERKEQIMGWLTQPYYEKGHAEGKLEGRSEGEIVSAARLLTRLLETRFGSLPSTIRERILAADVGSIEAWAVNAFDAPDLQAVFDR